VEEDLTLGPDTNLGGHIAQLRANIGISQAEACRRSGIRPDAWSRIERGEYVQVTWRTLSAALKGVGMRIKLEADLAPKS
jgi:transcriptional regulator with XRE-family HTH domain